MEFCRYLGIICRYYTYVCSITQSSLFMASCDKIGVMSKSSNIDPDYMSFKYIGEMI